MRELRAGVDGHELHLHYQPQVRVRDGRAAAVEALMRWQHPRRGLLLPGQFLPAAERTGVIKPLCDWAIETALDHCRQWREAGRPLNVAVNVSGRNLRDPLLSERLESLLGAARLDPACLKLEIPQDSILAEAHGASAALLRLRSTGVRVSIDDFGAAPASLASLKRLPVDEIKISGTLVREMAHDARDAAIVRCAVELAHGLGRQVVAQDVEDAASWRMLAEYGCDFAQGRYVSPVLTRAELGRWLDDSAPNAITRG
jgi:EAL domain-containing protein (putative c-di-GMP-specific phosphodiesterase class I)